MDKTNILQLEIEECREKMRDNNFKEQLSYFKSRDKKVHKMSKHMVMCYPISTLPLCHVFIKD